MHKEHFGEGILVQSSHRQVNAPDVKHFRPKNAVELDSLTSEIKKFLAGKFEDERIKSVKKTTNWNIKLGGKLTDVLSAEPELVGAWKEAVEDYMDPRN
jgi:hypothetical protein